VSNGDKTLTKKAPTEERRSAKEKFLGGKRMGVGGHKPRTHQKRLEPGGKKSKQVETIDALGIPEGERKNLQRNEYSQRTEAERRHSSIQSRLTCQKFITLEWIEKRTTARLQMPNKVGS